MSKDPSIPPGRVYEDVITIECPACGSAPGAACEYAEGCEHDGWVHIARTDEFYRATPS